MIHDILDCIYENIKQDNAHHYRNNIKKGIRVKIVEKQNQKNNIQTTGIVKDILTSKKQHTRGIKVRLTNNKVGRVQKILKKRSRK